MTPYRDAERVVRGSLAYWTAPRAPWWRRMLWALPDLVLVGTSYARWLERQKFQNDVSYLREIGRLMAQLRKAEETARAGLDAIAIEQVEIGENLSRIVAMANDTLGPRLNVLQYKRSMLRGERGIRELEDYFSAPNPS